MHRTLKLFPYDRIIEAFEVIVVSTVQNENFTGILIEKNDVAVLAERVSKTSVLCIFFGTN